MLRTAKGFRKLVHSVGVSIVGDLPDKVVTFTLGFSGELGSGGSRNSMKITTDGTEHIMVMDEQQWSDSDETPQEFLFELVKPKDIATATVKLYLNDGYTVPEVDPDPPVAFDTPAYSEMIARSCLSTGNNIRIKRVLQQLRDGKPTTIAFLGGSITQGAGAVPRRKCATRARPMRPSAKGTHPTTAHMSATSKRALAVRPASSASSAMTATSPATVRCSPI